MTPGVQIRWNFCNIFITGTGTYLDIVISELSVFKEKKMANLYKT